MLKVRIDMMNNATHKTGKVYNAICTLKMAGFAVMGMSGNIKQFG